MKTIAQLEAENGELIKKATGLEARAVQAEASVTALTGKIAEVEADSKIQAGYAMEFSSKVADEFARAEEATNAKIAAEEAAKAANMKLVEATAAQTAAAVKTDTETDADVLKAFQAINDNKERAAFYAKHKNQLLK